jgi:segregation and condensation protein B
MTTQDQGKPTPEKAGATGPQGTLGFDDVDESDLVQEFGDYQSLEDDDEPRSSAVQSTSDPALLTPKERRLLDMRLEARIEAIIFASQKPLKPAEILEIMGDDSVSEADVERSLDELVEFYDTRAGGFRLHYIKRLGYQFQTTDDAAAIMERMFASRPRPISRAALETLAIIAYRQPVTRAEVEFIRGVDAGSIFKTLLERDLIKCTGRKEIVGRPMLFGTTDEFLKVFNLSSVKDLPPLESFQPSRDLVQGARERLAEGQDEIVDVEGYIAEQMGDAAAGDEGEVSADETLAALPPELAAEGLPEGALAVAVEVEVEVEVTDEADLSAEGGTTSGGETEMTDQAKLGAEDDTTTSGGETEGESEMTDQADLGAGSEGLGGETGGAEQVPANTQESTPGIDGEEPT